MNILVKAMRQAVNKTRSVLFSEVKNVATQNLILAGRMASIQMRSRTRITSLADVEFRVSSQWGEDGIIDWLIERAQLPPSLHIFVEFGVEDYTEANTLFLMQNRNWRGLIMDGNPSLLRKLSKREILWRYDLSVRSAFITREDINSLLNEAGFSGEVGLLSVDIDGNDYWVWEAIDAINPVFCVCEYNAVFGDVALLTVPYDPEFQRMKKHFSGLYFGASIEALRALGTRKGYSFLGTNAAANDAFFVRSDYAHKFEGALDERIAWPSKCRQSRDSSGKLTFIGKLLRNRQEVAKLPVVDLRTEKTVALGQVEPIYSSAWLEASGG